MQIVLTACKSHLRHVELRDICLCEQGTAEMALVPTTDPYNTAEMAPVPTTNPYDTAEITLLPTTEP